MATSKAPPSSLDAEKALLGAIFIDNSALNDVTTIVRSPSQFYRTFHGDIYAAMLRLFDAGKEIDWVTVAHELLKTGTAYTEETLMHELCGITEDSPCGAGAEQYAEVVRDKYILRSVAATSARVHEAAYDPTVSASELIEQFEGEVFSLGAERFVSEIKAVAPLVAESEKQAEQFKTLRYTNDQIPGITSGFRDLDRITTGFKGGELIIIASRPGHGKTSLALNMATAVALSEGTVAMFSLEMTGVELVSRMVCSMADVGLKKIRLGETSNHDEDKLVAARKSLSATSMFIDDSFSLTMSDIRAKCRRLADKKDLSIVMVDYLQLIHVTGKLDRHEQIGTISRGLKALARELNVPVIAMAQLNRSIEQRRGSFQRPMLSDLRESGSIEQDADVVMFIQRDRMLDAAKYDEAATQAEAMDANAREQFDDVEPATLVVAKNRSGPIGDVGLMFRKGCTRFEAGVKYAEASFAQGRADLE